MATSDDTGTYIGDWDATQPEDSDVVSKGAAEIRKVKACVDATFPNFTGTAVTATEAELNYVDGVTSAIQTQLDLKAPLVSPTFATNVTVIDGAAATTTNYDIRDTSGNLRGFLSRSVSGLTVSIGARTTGGIDNARIDLKESGIIDLRPTSALHLNGADVTLASGTYTPTLTNVQYASIVSGSGATYLRIGNIVHVSMRVSVTSTSFTPPQSVQFLISLPIAASFTSTTDAHGSAVSTYGTLDFTGGIEADTASEKVLVRMYWSTTSGSSQVFAVQFQYQIA